MILTFFMVTNSYNKYSQITARAVRASFKEEHRVAAEKRGLTALRYQHWENGQGGQQVRFSAYLDCIRQLTNVFSKVLLNEQGSKESKKA